MINSAEENEDMITDCENRSEQLSDWECNFIDSIRRQFDNTNSLSDRQEEMLEKVWDKVTK